MQANSQSSKPMIGVGLRHAHFADALSASATVDFVEVHSENFFAEGGALKQILLDIADQYPVSLHSTAMGLGSSASIPSPYLEKLNALTQLVDPFLISDHAAFAWGNIDSQPVHGGDLLPPVYNELNLCLMVQNVDRIQQMLGRQILVENLSAYIALPGATMTEPEFLSQLTESTGCGLLLDLNNILVNAFNQQVTHQQATDSLQFASKWLDAIPDAAVGEIHLAGYTPVDEGDIAVDDHAQPVSQLGWQLYEHALRRFGHRPTLIEWDNNLPSWQVLVDEANKARDLALKITGIKG